MTATVISPQVESSLSKLALQIRPLQIDDYDHGYLDLLKSLTEVGDITKTAFTGIQHWPPGIGTNVKDRFQLLQQNAHHTTLVITSADKIVASGTLLIEPKFIRQCGLVGHIEDIVVSPDARGKSLGKLYVLPSTAIFWLIVPKYGGTTFIFIKRVWVL